jgi:hypothetical protein
MVGMLSAGLECFLQGWNAFCRVGMLSIELEFLCTGLKYIPEGWNAFDIVGIPLYRVGIPLYRVGMPSRGLDCFRQSWSSSVQG